MYLREVRKQIMLTLSRAQSVEEYTQAREIILAYQEWLGMDLCFQGFYTELEALETMYGPPSGALILARQENLVVGCVGLRDLGEGICEMKRMFVLPTHQEKGLGTRLFEAFMETARELGYRSVRLDTVRRLKVALHLYQKAGFREIEAYRYNPDPEVLYMQLDIIN